MALDVYFIPDVRRVIVAALVVAVETAAASERPNLAHVRGIVTMAKGTAASFGIPWSLVVYDARIALGEAGDLLDAGTFGALEQGL